jgi:hypothetical protein
LRNQRQSYESAPGPQTSFAIVAQYRLPPIPLHDRFHVGFWWHRTHRRFWYLRAFSKCRDITEKIWSGAKQPG